MERFAQVFADVSEQDLDVVRRLLLWQDAEEIFTDPQVSPPELNAEVQRRLSALMSIVSSVQLTEDHHRLDYVDVLNCAATLLGETEPDRDVKSTEQRILRAVAERIKQTLTPEQLSKLQDDLMAQIASQHPSTPFASALPLAAILAGEAGGFATYMAASTLMAALASAAGITLPFAAYTTLSTLLSVFLGPFGWVASGALACFGAHRYLKHLKHSKQHAEATARFLAFVLFLIGIRSRCEAQTSERYAQTEIVVNTLEQQRVELTNIPGEMDATAVSNLDAQIESRKAELASQKAELARIKEQIANSLLSIAPAPAPSNADEAHGLAPPPPAWLQPGRSIPLKLNGDHHSIFGDKKIASITDLPESVRRMFNRVAEHTATVSVVLGEHKPGTVTEPPKLRLQIGEGRLHGTLHSRAKSQGNRKRNACAVQILVVAGWESRVLDHLESEGLLT